MFNPLHPEIDRLIPLREALPLIGRRLTAAYADIKSGKLHIVKNGARTFVKASEVARYQAALETEGASTHAA